MGFSVARYYVSNIKRENWGDTHGSQLLGQEKFHSSSFTTKTRKDVEMKLEFGTTPKLLFPQLWFPLTVCAGLLKESEKLSIQNEKFNVRYYFGDWQNGSNRGET